MKRPAGAPPKRIRPPLPSILTIIPSSATAPTESGFAASHSQPSCPAIHWDGRPRTVGIGPGGYIGDSNARSRCHSVVWQCQIELETGKLQLSIELCRSLLALAARRRGRKRQQDRGGGACNWRWSRRDSVQEPVLIADDGARRGRDPGQSRRIDRGWCV